MSAISYYDKKRVAQYFGRAAAHYTHHDRLQRGIADMLQQTLNPVSSPAALFLDIGCGPAHHQPTLTRLGGHYVGIDLAPAMLAQAQQTACQPVTLIAADMEQLPLATASAEVLFSNLAMQWANHLPHLLNEWYRVLKPGGQIAASTVLAGSLQPLGDCFAGVDGQAHTNQWYDITELTAITAALPWQVHCAQHRVVQEFASVEEMLRELKGVGANYTVRSAAGLFSRERFERLKQAIEKHRNSAGMLELHWHIGVLSGTK